MNRVGALSIGECDGVLFGSVRVLCRLCAEGVRWLEGEDRRESGIKEVGLLFMKGGKLLLSVSLF